MCEVPDDAPRTPGNSSACILSVNQNGPYGVDWIIFLYFSSDTFSYISGNVFYNLKCSAAEQKNTRTRHGRSGKDKRKKKPLALRATKTFRGRRQTYGNEKKNDALSKTNERMKPTQRGNIIGGTSIFERRKTVGKVGRITDAIQIVDAV